MLHDLTNIRPFRHLPCALALSIFFFVHPASAEDTVKIKILAVNPSSSQGMKTTVAQYLPQEVTPDDIVDKEGLEIVYDSEKKAYLMKKEVELKPQETQTIEIRVKNVWTVTSEQLDEVRGQLKKSLNALKPTKYATTGQLLYEKAEETLGQIEENQSKSLGVMQRIDLYRMHMKQIEDLKQNALSLDAMRKIESDAKTGIRQVKFKINAENPAGEEKTLQVRSLLPRDITEKDILDKAGFEVTYDEDERAYALSMTDTLAANETRQYDVILRDVWYIPQADIDYLRQETDKLAALFKKSAFESFADKNRESIEQSLTAITALQTEVESGEIEDRMRAFVLNQQREKFAKRKFKELQDMLSEVNLIPKEETKKENPRLIRKLIDLKNRVLVAIGVQPKKSVYWWIFLGIVLFLAVITVIFYSTWLKRLKDNKWVAPPQTGEKKKAPDESKS